jgi:ketosteroid isomerase-like protein
MHRLVMFVGSALLISPALADDRSIITAQMQQLADAVVPGDVAVWDKYLDPNVIYAEENDTYKGKADALKEITPLPAGLSGTIQIVLLSYHEDGDAAVALFRQNETEHYFGQTIHATYLTSTTWKKRANGWKLLAEQVLAEKSDPPAINLTNVQLEQYAGTYRLKDSEATYNLTISAGKLVASRSGHKPATWNAEACDVFFTAGDPRIRNIFRRGSSGKVNGFVERREMWDIVWVKISQATD